MIDNASTPIDYQMPVPHRVLFEQRPPSFSLPLCCYPQALTSEVNQALDTIRQLQQLGDDWDGEGALAPLPATIANARGAAVALMRFLPYPDIVLNTNGTVTFEWESQAGVANFEVGVTRFSLFITPTSGASIYIDGDADSVSETVGHLVSSTLYPVFNTTSFTNIRTALSNGRFTG